MSNASPANQDHPENARQREEAEDAIVLAGLGEIEPTDDGEPIVLAGLGEIVLADRDPDDGSEPLDEQRRRFV